MTMGTSPFSITACTCCWFPAVMLDKNHTASCKWNEFGIFSLNRSNYLVDLLLAVVEKAWEVLQCSLKYSRIVRHLLRIGTKVHLIENRNLVQNSLRLIIRARHNISHSSQSCGLDFHLHNVGKSWTREGDIFLEISRKAQSGASNASGCARIV